MCRFWHNLWSLVLQKPDIKEGVPKPRIIDKAIISLSTV
jgi:hypothetical protein